MLINFLNLDASTDRLASFLTTNSHLTQTNRISAVDGRELSRATLRAENLLASQMPGYTDGALGCALSHVAQWREAAKHNKVITLAEDDAIFHRDFEAHAERVLSTLPAQWDIVLWGWNFDSILAFDLLPGVSSSACVFDQQSLRASTRAFQSLPVSPVAYRLHRAFGTVCQSVSPTGAAKLLRHCLPIREMEVFYPLLNRTFPNMGIDHMINDAYPRMQAYVSLPPLVITTNDRACSTVQTGA